MKFLIKKYLLAAASLFILTQIIPAIKINGSWSGLFYAAFILSVLFYMAVPMLNLVMLPINLITLNLSSWIIQIAIFYLWTLITNVVSISSWQFPGISFGPITLSSFDLVKWQVTMVAAIVYILTNKSLQWLLK